MKKWLAIIASVFVLLIIVIIGLYLSSITDIFNQQTTNTTSYSPSSIPSIMPDIRIQSSNYQSSDGLTAEEKMNAISVALNNSTIGHAMQTAESYTYVAIGNVTSANASKTWGIDSGFLNTSSKIAYVRISLEGTPMSSVLDSYAVYVNVLNNETLGLIIYGDKVGPMAYLTILPGSVWYHQLDGIEDVTPGDYTQMMPTISLGVEDVNTTSPIILYIDDFEKYKKGSAYKALQYVDYMTNATLVADGSKPINIIEIDNGTAWWRANVSISHASLNDPKYYNPQNYYMVIENKNVNKELTISYQA